MTMYKKLLLFILMFTAGACCYGQPPRDAVAAVDSATMPASLKYNDPSFLKRLFLGKNYRAAWSTPVTLPVFHLSQMGFTIKELGGGQQTKSLRLLDKNGREWALRTVDKDVEKALSPRLRNTLAEKVTQDMVSAAHPYAPLTVPVLAQAAGVVSATPVFYMVPDDPALGEYNPLFKNTLCMLEEREPTPDRSETKNTGNLMEDLMENNSVQVDAEAVLRARLLDMLIGDWDRHQDQWRWGFKNVEGVRYGYAIPRDRDQAYFHSKGLLVKLARAVSLKHLVGFAKTTSRLKKLNAKSWNFDRQFLNSLDRREWERLIRNFVLAVNDSVIHTAVKKFPMEVYPLHGSLIEQKLISRRSTLPKDALLYYRFISSFVTIAGTDAAERFVITSTRDSITVKQFAGADFSKVVYHRTFHRRDTYQVTIMGLDGADDFIQKVSGKPRIRLVLDGGKGVNVYKLASKRRVTFGDSAMDAKAYIGVLKKALRITD
jgi:hypothetical protein